MSQQQHPAASSGEQMPPFVAVLAEDPDMKVLCWGGDDSSGFVEWREPDVFGDSAKPMRRCRRWRVVGDRRLQADKMMPEFAIKLSDGLAWRELMRASKIEFDAAVRHEARKLEPRR